MGAIIYCKIIWLETLISGCHCNRLVLGSPWQKKAVRRENCSQTSMWVTHTHTLYHASFFDGLHGFFTVFSARFTLFQALEHMNINDLKVEMIDYFPVRRFNHSSYQYWCLNCLGLDPTLLTHSLDLTKNVTRWNRFSAIIETRFDSVASNPTVKGCLGRSGHICIYTYIYIYVY